MADEKPIIVVKKKGGHGGHHGGAWKVAYADFVTAMMAFFMVMWLVNSAEVQTRKNIASYFKRPGIFEAGSGTPLMLGQSGIMEDGFIPTSPKSKRYASGNAHVPVKKKSGTDNADLEGEVTKRGTPLKGLLKGKGQSYGFASKAAEGGPTQGLQNGTTTEVELPTKELLEKLAQDIQQQAQNLPNFKDLVGTVDVKMDADGLNIEIMDTDKVSMFQSGSAVITSEAQDAFSKIGELLNTVPNTIEIVGHTDGEPFSSRNALYSNWELSSDRANAARRLLERVGVSAERITSVLGRADRELKIPESPLAAANRRITFHMKIPKVEKSAQQAPVAEPDPMEKLKQQLAENENINTEDKAHAATTQAVLEQQKLKDKTPIILPPDSDPNSSQASKDQIFSDYPVIGPSPSIMNGW